ncbi:MAG: alpha-ketoglutarate-dependent dioxygenase AlkB [Pseudonocardiaceae bacterium]|nr:alpha-ketoglutarate-dependent dioxygenase AlkB [Pseudonocardiaceae bacterium]
MTAHFQPSLFGAGDPEPDASFTGLQRHQLDEQCWIDVASGWLSGADTLFLQLAESAPWQQRDRWMYDHRVLEPRLTCSWSLEQAPSPLGTMAALLSQHYGVDLDTVAANYYRDGRDSVAWHGDRVRLVAQRPLVAIVSLGSRRRFGLRPRGGGQGRWFAVDGGDLLVMGGRSQHDWEHSVPKSARGGPRISVTYRHSESGE